MTDQADIIRDKRRHLATPGGVHDRLIKLLMFALPVAIGVLAALMVLAPLTPRSEISFLLDRNKVELTENRMTVGKAMYRGSDNDGRPFSVLAGKAVQQTRDVQEIEMDDLTARLLLADGPARLMAPQGVYDFGAERVRVPGAVTFEAADGYRMVARDVAVDLNERTLVGQGRVEGAIPAGTFSADRLEVDLQERTISLIGDARLRMSPGELRLPR
jgi:lipopolysaccharide export system protein LptC